MLKKYYILYHPYFKDIHFTLGEDLYLEKSHQLPSLRAMSLEEVRQNIQKLKRYDKKKPSVTQVLKYYPKKSEDLSLLFWLNRMTRESYQSYLHNSKIGRTRGTSVHTYLEEYFKYGKLPEDTTELGYNIRCFLEKEGKEISPLNIEQFFEGACYTGTCDLIAFFEDKVALIDFKTTKDPKRSRVYDYGKQLFLYQRLLNEHQVSLDTFYIAEFCTTGSGYAWIPMTQEHLEAYQEEMDAYLKWFFDIYSSDIAPKNLSK